MTRHVESTTAILAAAFGGMLFAADTLGQNKTTLDAKTAKELAIISRVLEKRLSDARAALTATATALTGSKRAESGGGSAPGGKT